MLCSVEVTIDERLHVKYSSLSVQVILKFQDSPISHATDTVLRSKNIDEIQINPFCILTLKSRVRAHATDLPRLDSLLRYYEKALSPQLARSQTGVH